MFEILGWLDFTFGDFASIGLVSTEFVSEGLLDFVRFGAGKIPLFGEFALITFRGSFLLGTMPACGGCAITSCESDHAITIINKQKIEKLFVTKNERMTNPKATEMNGTQKTRFHFIMPEEEFGEISNVGSYNVLNN